MTFPKAPDDEARIAFLRSLALLDTATDEHLERIVRVCRQVFGVSAASISLVDGERQWFKSHQGLDACETDRELAFCNYTIMSDRVFEVPDTHDDEVFRTNELVTGPPHLRYYAGAPLTYDGVRLGSLCLLDVVPRTPLTPAEREVLVDLAAVVVREFKVQRLLRESLARLAEV